MIYIILLLCLFTRDSSCQVSSLETGANLPLTRFLNKEYFIQNVYKGTVEETNRFCNKINMRGLSIESEKENNFLQDLVTKQFGPTYIEIFTSGVLTGNTFYWESNSSPVRYTNWCSRQPNSINNTATNIILAFYNTALNSTKWCWALGYSTIPRYAICEIRLDDDFSKMIPDALKK